VFNAANEAAADGFFAGAITFPRIVGIIEEVLAAADQWTEDPGTVDDVLAADAWARERARLLVAGVHR
jgi:1-deoxy-D-xylulose-5-phosphate reductoisomerase